MHQNTKICAEDKRDKNQRCPREGGQEWPQVSGLMKGRSRKAGGANPEKVRVSSQGTVSSPERERRPLEHQGQD